MPDDREFEWDEAKQAINKVKHGIDFLDAIDVFDARYYEASARAVGGEARQAATGPLGGSLVTVIFVMRDGVTRIISARRARTNERRRYEALLEG